MNETLKNRCIDIARMLMPLRRTGRAFHVSFILNKRKIILWATNDYNKNHYYHLFGKYTPTKSNSDGKYVAGLHSEIVIIKRYMQMNKHSDFSGLTLFNVRIGYDGKPMMAKPCDNCKRIVEATNFKEINWTENESC